MVKRPRGALAVTLAIAAVATLGCTPDPPPPDPTTTTTSTTTTTTTTTSTSTTTTTTTTTTVPNAAPDVEITSPSGDVSVNEIDVVELAATASDAEDGDLSGSVSWTLLAEEPDATPVDLGTGATTTAGPLAPGSYTITASVTDSDGLTATDQIQATVAACKINLILTPGGGQKDAGPLHLSAAQSSDSCDRPLIFGWLCTSHVHPLKCVELRAAAAGLDMTEYTYDLAVDEMLEIGLEVCTARLNGQGWKCETKVSGYLGIEPFLP